MMSVSRLALGAVLALGASGVLVSAPADAQRAPRGNRNQQAAPAAAAAQPAGPALTLSAPERTALVALQTAAEGTDRAAQDAALTAARAVVRGPDAHYAFSGLQFRIGRQREDRAMLMESIEGLLASNSLPPKETLSYLRIQYEMAREANQPQVADRALARLVQIE